MYIKTIDLWQSVFNIIAVYDRVAPDVDTHWYTHAFNLLATDADKLGYDVTVYVHAVAAYSPMVDWERNVNEVRRIAQKIQENKEWQPMKADRFIGIFGNVVKAFQILKTGDVSLCRGEKVESFARNLLGDADGVTIDRHAIHIAQNGLWAIDTKSGDKHIAPGFYGQYAQAYKLAAALITARDRQHITGSQVQATTWTYCAR